MYQPNEDSFLLTKYVKKYAKGKVLDVGTGSGILAKAALENTKDVLAVDINQEAVEYCRKKGINAIKSDLFENIKGKFDLIVFNPPYLPYDPDEDYETSLITKGGVKGYEIIERFLMDSRNYLNHDGIIIIVFSTLTGDVESIIRKYGYKFEVLEEKPLFFEKLKVLKLKLM
ncbi:methyltransferase [Candidatus Woesearchaeota archaeon]|nr:methyltransferase [Candidatus Woesearchaeota archaeon]